MKLVKGVGARMVKAVVSKREIKGLSPALGIRPQDY